MRGSFLIGSHSEPDYISCMDHMTVQDQNTHTIKLISVLCMQKIYPHCISYDKELRISYILFSIAIYVVLNQLKIDPSKLMVQAKVYTI